MVTGTEIKKKYIDFFVNKKNHKQILAEPLIAENDPTLLFVNSGMFPLVPYLLGEKHPMGTRLVNYQRCFRSDDIDEVGDARHTTCFEMLGNWSLADYFKKEQLPYWYEFLIEELGLDINRIYQTVYGGSDGKAPKDDESIETLKEIFKKYGVENPGVGPATTGKGEMGPGVEIDFTKDKIFEYTDKNWWQRGDAIGEVGGPDTETFYDTGKPHNPEYGPHCHPNCDCGRFIEIGNSVFIQYVLTENGWEMLKNRNVDFGGGLERLAMAVNGKDNVFETKIFSDYIALLEEASGVSYKSNPKPFEVITDHIRAIVFMIMDGGMPSNKDQGYFVRRLIRRVLVQLHNLNVPFEFIDSIAAKIVENMSDYPMMKEKETHIRETILAEQKAFAKTLTRGMKYLEDMIATNGKISGEDAFVLQATYGFPFEIIKEEAENRNIELDEKGYFAKVEEHQELSRKGAEQKFKSGLADTSEQTTQYHTLTHILHQTLRNVLGDHVEQRGSNITAERLRFDFSHPEKMTPEQKEEVTNRINKIIQDGFVVDMVEMPYEDAVAKGVIGLFKDKYDGIVKVYTIYDKEGNVLSKELCSGPHMVDSTALEGLTFKIKKEESSSAGVRRIKALLK